MPGKVELIGQIIELALNDCLKERPRTKRGKVSMGLRGHFRFFGRELSWNWFKPGSRSHTLREDDLADDYSCFSAPAHLSLLHLEEMIQPRPSPCAPKCLPQTYSLRGILTTTSSPTYIQRYLTHIPHFPIRPSTPTPASPQEKAFPSPPFPSCSFPPSSTSIP